MIPRLRARTPSTLRLPPSAIRQPDELSAQPTTCHPRCLPQLSVAPTADRVLEQTGQPTFAPARPCARRPRRRPRPDADGGLGQTRVDPPEWHSRGEPLSPERARADSVRPSGTKHWQRSVWVCPLTSWV